MFVTVLSFGFKYGIPEDADLVFDVRFLPNPYYVEEPAPADRGGPGLRPGLCDGGRHRATGFLDKLYDMMDFLLPNYISEGKNQLVVAVGCTGRQAPLRDGCQCPCGHLTAKAEYGIKIEHRDIDKDNKRK